MTDAFKRRRRRAFGSLEAVRIRLRWAYLDRAIAIRWLMATSGSPYLDCITPRYLKCRKFESSASTSLTFSSSSCSAFFFTSFTSVSAADPARDGSLLDGCDRTPIVHSSASGFRAVPGRCIQHSLPVPNFQDSCEMPVERLFVVPLPDGQN